MFIQQFPVLGIGPGSFLQLSSRHVGAHNLILTVLLDLGIVGAAVMLLVFVSMYRVLLAPRTQTGAFVAVMFTIYVVPIASSGHWEASPLSWLVVAFAYNASRYGAKNSVARAELE